MPTARGRVSMILERERERDSGYSLPRTATTLTTTMMAIIAPRDISTAPEEFPDAPATVSGPPLPFGPQSLPVHGYSVARGKAERVEVDIVKLWLSCRSSR